MSNYKGYRLKIKDYTIEDVTINKGSYSFHKEDRVIDSYEDADKTLHEIVAAKQRAVISFAFREHESSEHLGYARIISQLNNVTVEYWDDYEEIYETGKFKIDPVDFSHRTTIGDTIKYNPATVKLTEY